MPSLTYTPGALTLTGGEINPEPVRFSFTPAVLRLAGGTFNVGASLSSSLTEGIAALLDTLSAAESIVDAQGRPTRRFQQIWQNTIQGIKDILTTQGLSIGELQSIYAGINTAQATATAAVQTAQNTSDELALVNSFTDPVGVGTASSAGTVTIAAHSRVYGDGTQVAVNGGSVSGFAAGDYVTVYYSDPAKAGGAVSYQGTTQAISQTGSTHIVWQGTIPAAGQPDAQGTGPTAPGYTPPSDDTYDYSGLAYFQ